MTKPKTNPILTKTLATTSIGHNRPGNQNRRGGGGTTAHDKLSGQLPSHKLSKNKLPRQAFKLSFIAFVATALIASLFTATPVSAQSTDATLSGLAISEGVLKSDIGQFIQFASETLAYSASVANSVENIAVTPTITDSAATLVITVGGTIYNSDEDIPLTAGVFTIITITVTAEDGTTTQDYTITVVRAAATASSNATLQALELVGRTLAPTFDAATTEYTASVANSAATAIINATVASITATHVIMAGGITYNSGDSIPLVVGENTIAIVVTASDVTTTETYTIVVTRAVSASMDATLSGIVITYDAQGGRGIQTPATFDSATADYTYQVLEETTTITVAPTTTESTATVSINGGTAVADTTSEAITLTDDSTTITFLVTARDGITTMTYTITVIKTAVFIYETEPINLSIFSSKIIGYEPVFATDDSVRTNTEIGGTVRGSYNLPYLSLIFAFLLADSPLVPSAGVIVNRTTTRTAGVGWSSIQTHSDFSTGDHGFRARSCTEPVVSTISGTEGRIRANRGVSSSIEATPLPYVRQITLTQDDDDTTTTDTTDPLNLGGTASSTADYNVCILPEGLQDSSFINERVSSLPVVVVAAYTPPTGWVVKDPDTVTLITPSATSTFTLSESVARDGGTALASAEVVLSFDPDATHTGNGFSSVSVSTTGLNEGRALECLLRSELAAAQREITRAAAEALLCQGQEIPTPTPTNTTTTTTTFSPSAQPPTLGSLVPGTTNLAVSCGFRLLGQCQNLPDFHSPAIKVNTDVDLFDFSIKAMSPDRPLKEFYLGFGLPRVGSPIQSAKASVTIELAQNPDSIVGYEITDVRYQGIENPNAFFWLSLESCSRFSNAICIVASIGDLELYEGFEVEPMAIQVTDTSGETSRYYLAG